MEIIGVLLAYIVGTITGAHLYARTLRARFFRISTKVLQEIADGKVKEGRDVHIEVISANDEVPTISGGSDVGC